MFDGQVFDKALYDEMRHFEKMRKQWIQNFGTDQFFEQWYELMQETKIRIECQPSLSRTIREIGELANPLNLSQY